MPCSVCARSHDQATLCALAWRTRACPTRMRGKNAGVVSAPPTYLMRPAGPQWEALLQQRPADQHSPFRAPLGGLLTDRAPAGTPVTGLLMGCRARIKREHLIIRLQVSPGAASCWAI